MPLDPKVQMFLNELKQSPSRDLSVAEARQQFHDGVELLNRMMPPPPIKSREDFQCATSHGDVPIRLYRPMSESRRNPLVFFHGGGFVLGDIESYDGFVARLSTALSAPVFSVGYHLAPEARFPQPVEESMAVVEYIATNAGRWGFEDPALIVAGDSAGGNLSAVVAQLAEENRRVTIRAQILLYPTVNMIAPTPSKELFAKGYFLEAEDMVWFGEKYLESDEDLSNPLASPALRERLTGLPPTLIITAEYDPLRDEGEAYGAALKKAGVPTTVIRFDGVIHGFMSIPLFDQASAAMAAVRDFWDALER